MTRAQYVAEWAVKAHRNPSDVYVPRALQPNKCTPCGWTRVDGEHRNCNQGKW